MSDLAAILVGMGIGAVVVGPVLWRHRREIKQSWAEVLGIATEGSTASGRVSPVHGQSGDSSQLFTATLLTVGLIVAVGSAVVAVTTSDAAVRVVNIIVSLISVIGVSLFLRARL